MKMLKLLSSVFILWSFSFCVFNNAYFNVVEIDSDFDTGLFNENMNEEDFMNLLTAMLSGDQNSSEGFVEKIKEENNKEKDKVIVESAGIFNDFQNNLSVYFPKVFNICNKFFVLMTPEDVAKSFRLIVDMFTDSPWLYLESMFKQVLSKFSDDEKAEWKQKGYDLDFISKIFDSGVFKKWIKNAGGNWEFVVDQLYFYEEFIDLARVNLADNSVFIDPNAWSYFDWGFSSGRTNNKNNQSKSLIDYWRDSGITVYQDFYALFFDYWAKLFLENILNQDLEGAYGFYEELKITMDRLSGTVYEAERQETIKTYRELLDILKQKKSVQRFDNSNMSDSDKYWNEKAQAWDMD